MLGATTGDFMPTIVERLLHVTLKIKRAKEHFVDLERQVRAFFETNPYRVACKVDPGSRKPIYYVASVEPVPQCLPLVAGDVIQILMSALDHLAYQLVCSDTGDKPPNPNWIYFPIQDDATKYEARKRGKIEGAAQETIDAIDALKPYKGGNDLLWMLYRLNNVEKHRLLLTVGSAARGINLAQAMARHIPNEGEFAGMRDALGKMSLFIKPDDKGFPLKPGFELYIGAPDEEPDPNQQFRFDVALNEPGIVESKSLLGTLHELTILVESIVAALTPSLKDTA
jgi:hypothetical protein